MDFDTIEMKTLDAGEREKVLTDLFGEPDTPPVETSHITNADLRDALLAVAAENPGRVYTAPEHMDANGQGRCFYVHTDPETGEPVEPGCIVGTALHRLGVPLDSLMNFETLPAAEVLDAFFKDVSAPIMDAYSLAQARQDTGRTWQKAVADASVIL
ncbi:hypothetical protein ACWDTQ_26530 [Streptomyces cellulosae]